MHRVPSAATALHVARLRMQTWLIRKRTIFRNILMLTWIHRVSSRLISPLLSTLCWQYPLSNLFPELRLVLII
jgi:hypothetical protein